MTQTKRTSATCEVDICFHRIPTFKQAIKQKMFSSATPLEMLVWFPSMWTAGRYGHVFFVHTAVAYHVGVLGDSKRRQEYNEAERTTHTFRIRVTIENLAKATLLVEEAQANPWFHPWQNCTHTISTLIYGYPNHYAWIGSFGWATRRVLKDVRNIEASQR